MTKKVLHIALGLYVVIECLFLMLGDTSSKWWSIAYFVNQSVLIIGVLIFLSDYVNAFLINAIIILNLVKIGYNVLFEINEGLATKVNESMYIGAILILLLITAIIRRQNDRKRKIKD